jgi:hypothetical protein
MILKNYSYNERRLTMIKTVAELNDNIVSFVYIDKTDETISMELTEYIKLASKIRLKTYIHNIAYEAPLLTKQLLENGYKHTSNKFPTKAKEFKKIEGEDLSTFKIMIKYDDEQYISIIDSKKILNFKPEELEKTFLDEKKKRNNLQIVADSLSIMFDHGFNSDTLSSNAFAYWKKISFIDSNHYKAKFPKVSLEVDDFIRESYAGSWVYLNPETEGKRYKGITLDVNSLFPSVMYTELMPWGTPKYFKGKYVEDRMHPLYIQRVNFGYVHLKDGKLPCMQFDGPRKLLSNEYLIEEFNIELYLTNVDLELILDSYEVEDVEYIEGYKFRGQIGLFKDYIDYFFDIKINEVGSRKQLAKIFLNALYGKFASKVYRKTFDYNIVDDKELKTVIDNEIGTMYYTALSAFISSYARRTTVMAANANIDNFLYADTDAIHLKCSLKEVKDIKLDEVKMGYWKIEREFTDSIYLGLKTYGEKDKNGWTFKVAGLPKEACDNIDPDNFKVGFEVSCKVKLKTYRGIEIVERMFKLSSNKIGLLTSNL